MWLLSIALLLYVLPGSRGKWVEGRVDTKENWAFLARFCFLSLEGQFEYLIEFDRDMGIPNLLLYYDDDSQWPAVYHSSKTCKEREAMLNKAGQNQIIRLSHWYPDTEYSGCVVTRENKELPAAKSTTTLTTTPPTTKTTTKPRNSTKNEFPLDPAYYDQFLKTTTPHPKATIVDNNSTIWYELPTEFDNITTNFPEDELWESIEPAKNGSHLENLKDVEILFDNDNKHKIKRSIGVASSDRVYRHFLTPETDQNRPSSSHEGQHGNTERLVVSCHNSRRFRSARERWWFIAISNCDGTKGLDVKYKFLMTNGPEGDFWHEHFSADEFYVLPVLLAYTFAYVIVMVAVVMCSVELKSRHLLHSTYKLFLISIALQHFGVTMQSLAYIRYAANGIGSESAKVTGQFACGMSESTFVLLLLLLGHGYTVTRGRLSAGRAATLAVFMCCYVATYIVLFIYQAKAFDPGEVLYLYESPAGYGLIVLRVIAWAVFAHATFCTVRKHPEKNMFYCPFFICGTLWFYAGPLFILTANSYIDKWVRESVVTAVLLFITFSGHVMFLLLTLPVFANKNFPYHVRTTQIGVMEVTGSAALDSFGSSAYHPSSGVPQTVIIPLTRRTEELIGNMYSQYMAPLSLENGAPSLQTIPKRMGSTKTLIHQSSSDTNTSEDIKPYLTRDDSLSGNTGSILATDNSLNIGNIRNVENKASNGLEKPGNAEKNLSKTGNKLSENYDRNSTKNKTAKNPSENVDKNAMKNEPNEQQNAAEIFTVDSQMAKIGRELNDQNQDSITDSSLPTESLPSDQGILVGPRSDLPSVLRSRRTILEPIKMDVPKWSLAKGPSVVAMQRKNETDPSLNSLSNGSRTIFSISNLPANGNLPSNGNLPGNDSLPGKKVPPVRNGLKASSGEISTILEGHIQDYKNTVSKATIDLFSVGSNSKNKG